MTMAPGLRRLTYTAHITSSVGWIGAVFVFLALALIAMTSQDERTVRGAYLVMAPAAWFVLVPLAHASLLSGIALSLGTAWGLFRHYWVVLKLLIAVFATVILLIYMGTFRQMAGIAADPAVDLEVVRNASPIVHSILALILLIAATVLGVYKPLGMTPYGARKHGAQRQAADLAILPSGSASAPDTATAAQWTYLFAIIAVGFVLLFVLLHFVSSGLRH
jgi:uncharacterized membrane protein